MPPRRNKYRKWKKKRRYKKNYRRSYKSRGRYKRVLKGVKVRGFRKKLDHRAEMKWTYYISTQNYPILGQGGAPTTIWDCNGRDPTNAQYIRLPYYTGTTGGEVADRIGQSGLIGIKFNSLYAEIRVTGRIYADVATQEETLRVMILRMRNPAQDGTNYAPLPTRLVEPVDTKLWDLWYDKYYNMTTGCTLNYTIGGQGYTYQSLAPKPMYWRFKIPLRQTMNLKASRIIYPYPIVICALSRHGTFRITEQSCKFYYRDP